MVVEVGRFGSPLVAIGGAALAASWVTVARDHRVPDWEADVFAAINGLPEGWWPVIWGPMQAGSFVGSLAIAGAVGVAARSARLGFAAAVAAQLAYWLSKAVKAQAQRGRPGTLLAEVTLHEDATGLGYVSGHTAVSFAVATAIAPALPRWARPVAYLVALGVGTARVYAGAHLPLDVVGGAGLGVLCGSAARWAFGLDRPPGTAVR